MTQSLQWLVPAIAVIAVGALSLIGAWHAPVRNDRAVALQELEIIQKLKEAGQLEAAEKVSAVVDARIAGWKWTTMFHFSFVRLALTLILVAAMCFSAALLLAGAFGKLWPTADYENSNVFKTVILLIAVTVLLLTLACFYLLIALVSYFITRKREKGKAKPAEVQAAAPSSAPQAAAPAEVQAAASSTGPQAAASAEKQAHHG